MMPKTDESLLAYYQSNKFNPVLISVEAPAVWEQHFAKRRNLYERHLGIPLPLLRGARVLEFGPNSGENSLVPALFGSRLTLVEPNDQVLPRLNRLFEQFGVESQIDAVHCETVDGFTTQETYDLVIAEGFLYTLPNRDSLLRKIVHLIAPGKFGIVSINDQYGGLLELLRRAILFQACRLSRVEDVQGTECLRLAQDLYADDFSRLKSSRSFEAWWKDTLVNPFYATEYLWSFPAVLEILKAEQCEFYSSSPVWATFQHYNWYKNLMTSEQRHEFVLKDWCIGLAYFLTGLRPQNTQQQPVDEKVIVAVEKLTADLSDASRSIPSSAQLPIYPAEIDQYLSRHTDALVQSFNLELQRLFKSMHDATRFEDLLAVYGKSNTIRSCWGTPYHYVCFQRQ